MPCLHQSLIFIEPQPHCVQQNEAFWLITDSVFIRDWLASGSLKQFVNAASSSKFFWEMFVLIGRLYARRGRWNNYKDLWSSNLTISKNSCSLYSIKDSLLAKILEKTVKN